MDVSDTLPLFDLSLPFALAWEYSNKLLNEFNKSKTIAALQALLPNVRYENLKSLNLENSKILLDGEWLCRKLELGKNVTIKNRAKLIAHGKIVLGDLKTSNGPYYSQWPGSDTPKNEYGKRRSGFMKYQKCQLQLAAYALGLEHTIGVVPELCMTFVATKEISQVFVIQKGTIEKYKNKWRETVKKYYEVILPEQKEREIEMLGIDGDIM